MAGEGMVEQDFHQFPLRQAAGLPELGIHADRGEARQSVHLVDEEAVSPGSDPRKKSTRARPRSSRVLKVSTASLLDLLRLVSGQRGGNAQQRAIRIDILRVIAVEAMAVLRARPRPGAMPGPRRDASSSTGAFDFPGPSDALFHEHLCVISEGSAHRPCRTPPGIGRAGDADG